MSEFWEIYDSYIKRDGADKLRLWIRSTDFETAPASTKYHESYRGGLAEHSVNVFHELVRLLKVRQGLLRARINTLSCDCPFFEGVYSMPGKRKKTPTTIAVLRRVSLFMGKPDG